MISSSIYLARNNISSLIKQAEFGETIELTRHEKPVAVLLSYENYENFTNTNDDFLDSLEKLKMEFSDVLVNMNESDFEFPVHKAVPNPNRMNSLFE